MTLKQTYTCDKCGEVIPAIGIGYVTKASLVIARFSIPQREDGEFEILHLHHACFIEWIVGLNVEMNNAP